MYADYRRKSLSASEIRTANTNEQHTAQTASNKHVHTTQATHGASTNEEAKVKLLWQEIEKQCENAASKDQPTTRSRDLDKQNDAGTTWRIVRVFVSSTFTDFHNEREVLVKKVFPRVHDWCEGRYIRLLECDLRWGVPQDSTTQTTIAACMDEIDRCHEENQGEPFFIGMLGERYGWIPGEKDVPPNASYQWIDGLSVTHMEIQHGAYRLQNPNAMFFLRHPDFAKDLPDNKKSRFVDTDPLARDHMKALKAGIEHRFPDQTFHFSASYDGLDHSTGREQVKLSGLENFEETVTSKLIAAIERTYPNQKEGEKESSEDNDITADLLVQEQMIERLSSNIVCREKEVAALVAYGKGHKPQLPLFDQYTSSDDDADTTTKSRRQQSVDFYKLEEEDERLMCVTGGTGIGKSSLLAAAAKEAKQQGLTVLYHNVGGSPNSKSSYLLLKQIIQAMEHTIPENVYSVSLLQDEMVTAIQHARCAEKQLLLFIDGVDELDDVNHLSHLFWLPVRLPSLVRCVVSFKEDQSPSTRFKMAIADAYHLELSALSQPQQEQLVASFFNNYNKKLSPSQLSSLLVHASASLPLWLHVTCEELRVHGDFATLSARIQNLPDSLAGLMESIIQRLIKEDDTSLMHKLLCLLHHSPSGLPEVELSRLLGKTPNDKPAQLSPKPALHVATLRLRLKPLLRTISTNGVSRLQFFHPSVADAVKGHMEASAESPLSWHTFLADFYEYDSRDTMFDRQDLPYHLLEAKLFKRLYDFYQFTNRGKFIPGRMKREFIMKLRCSNHANANLPNATSISICNFCEPDRCFMCGDRHGGAKFNTHAAILCHMHGGGHVMKNTCQKCAKFSSPQALKPAFVCVWCDQGVHANKCAYLKTK